MFLPHIVTGKALAMRADCNTRLCYINPELGAAAAVMESGRNVAMTGADPKAITDCLNFGNPTNPAYRDWETDRKSTRLNSSHITRSRMPSSA